jgi:predicted NBD/HSP70 family sugar kinase
VSATPATPGTPRLLRALNDRSALDLLLEHGPLTRTRIGELTGLSKPTASQLLARLEVAGLVRAAGTTAGSPGPGAQLYTINARAGLAAGVDVTPFAASAEVVDLAARSLGRADIDLPRAAADRTPGTDVHRALTAAAHLAGVDPGEVSVVVVGAQGGHDEARDILVHAGHMPGWSRPGLLAGLRQALGVEVSVEIDVNLAAVAERAAQTAPAHHCSALLWLGDGLGLAVHLGAVLHRGATGGAGEIGYMPVPHPSRRGSVPLQDLLGGPEVLRLARRHGVSARTPQAAVARALHDPSAASFLTELAARVAVGLAAIVAVLDPDMVVLGGPVGRAGGAELRDLVSAEIARICPLRPRLAVSAVPADPVLAGAVAVALARCRERAFSGGGSAAHPAFGAEEAEEADGADGAEAARAGSGSSSGRPDAPVSRPRRFALPHPTFGARS